MNTEEASYEIWKNADDKTVVFLPMVHAGKPAFYQDVKDLISHYKQEGFVVFYEGVKKDQDSDTAITADLPKRYFTYSEMHFPDSSSVSRIVYILKFKRMIGITLDSASYVAMLKSSSLTKKAVLQPSAVHLGISGTDLNIDISLREIVDEFEKKFGTIELEQIDFAIPLYESLPAHRRLKKDNTHKVIIDYRNEILSHSIQISPFRKILVVYGLAHKKGTFKELSEFDHSWKVVKS